MSALLTQALENASLQAHNNQFPPGSPRLPSSQSLSPNHDADSDDEEVIAVRTPAHSRPPSRATSRSTSPTRRSKAQRREDSASSDPLRRLPNALSCRIFSQLSAQDLARCSRVSKRWKRSQTLNWCWYCLFQQKAFEDYSEDNKPQWTRRESKQDWKTKYRSTYRRDDLEFSTAVEADYDSARSEGYRTPREEREDRWSQENEEASGTGSLDKAAARAYYKSLKNSKVKGKGSGFGSPRDKTGWVETQDEY